MRGSQHLSAKQIAEEISNRALSKNQIREAKKLRNWTDGEAPPQYRKGIAAFTKLINNEEGK